MSRLEAALAKIDAANSADPNSVEVAGATRPAELVYGQRMTATLARLYPEASEALRLAVRAQHIRRWEIPRQSYPMDRPGYLAWRSDLKARHAEWAGAILAECGYGADDIARVASLIRKENLKQDAEAQALEDAAALVFLEYYAADFAPKHTPEKVKSILAKTFAKMSPLGRKAAQDLPLPEPLMSLVHALASPRPRTRSAATPGTTKVAAILASHGDRAGDAPNANLIAQAASVRELTGLPLVAAGVLKGDPSLEEAISHALDEGADEILIYPLFMADGYFVKKVLPERIAASGFKGTSRILTPLGLDQRMPALLLKEAVKAAGLAGFDPATTRVLVVGHGSKLGPASADATRLVATHMASTSPFREIATAFLEEIPFVDAALAASQEPTIVVGFFFGDGMHAAEDVPEAIAETGARAIYTGAIGSSTALPQMIADALQSALTEAV